MKDIQAFAPDIHPHRIFMDNARDGMVILNQEHRVVETNQAFARMLGYTCEELFELHVWDWEALTPEEEIKETFKDISTLDDIFETRHRRKDGTMFDVEISAASTQYLGQNVSICVCRDITQRKETEKKLRESENRYRSLFNQSVAGIYLHDLQGRILDVNEEACFQVGYTREELLKMNVFDIHPKEPGTINLPDDRVLQLWEEWQPQDKFSMEIAHQHKDGRIIPIHLSTGVVFENEHKRILAITQDISQRKEMEKEREEKRDLEEKMAYKLTESIPVGTYTMVQPPTGGMARFEFMSRRFLELSGLTREEAASDPLKAFASVHPDDFDSWVALNAKSFEEKTAFYGETRIIHNGEIRWMSAESIPRTLPDGSTIWEGVLIDITDRKNSEAKLQEFTNMLEQKNRELETAVGLAHNANEAKSRYLAHMNHEIRTPLNGFLGFVGLMENTSLSQRQQEFLVHMKQSASHMLSIINNVLDMATIEAGKIRLVNRAFLLEEEVETALAPLRSLSSQNNTQLKITMDEQLPRRLNGDPDRLRQIILNLGSNAVKYTPNGQVHITLACRKTNHKHHTLQLVVEDNGSGMTKETLNKLFQPFYRVDDGSTPQAKGTGLGLTITKELVELMDGTIMVDSTLGKGTRVEVTLVVERETGPDLA